MESTSDRVKAILLSAVFFLIITSYYVIKPLRNSMVTAVLGTDTMATLNLALIVVISIAVFVFNHLLGKLKKVHVISGTYIFFVLNLFLFWCLIKGYESTTTSDFPGVLQSLHRNFDYLSGIIFFLWVGAYNVIQVSLFFIFCNDIFSSENAKKYYGLIGSGGVIGGVAGSEISAFFVEVTGSTNLLLISSMILLLAVFIMWAIFSILRSEKKYDELMNRKIRSSEQPSLLDAIKIFRKSRYAVLIAWMMFILTMMATFLNFMLSNQTEIEIEASDHEILLSLGGEVADSGSQEKGISTYGLGQEPTFSNFPVNRNKAFEYKNLTREMRVIFDERKKRLKKEKAAEFWAEFYTYMGYLSIFIQLCLTKFMNTRFGVPFSVFILPGVMILGFSAMCFTYHLNIVWWLSLLQFSLGYSIFQSSKEQLFLPADEEVKYRAKSVIDSIVVRGADAISSFTFHVLITLMTLSYDSLVFAGVFLCLPLVLVLSRLRNQYYRLLSQSLQAG